MFTPRITPPFRFDTVGSFLRPKILDEAKQAYANGIVDKEYLTKVEDGAILDFVSKQEKVGLKCVGDGEFRRNYWHMDFFWALDGIEKIYDESVPRSEFSDHYVVDTVGPVGYSRLVENKSKQNWIGSEKCRRLCSLLRRWCPYEL